MGECFDFVRFTSDITVVVRARRTARNHLKRRCRFGPRLLEHLCERLGRLRARDAVFIVEDEERDASDPEVARALLFSAHVIRVNVRGEHVFHGVRIESDTRRDLDEDVMVADMFRVDEIRLQERF